MNVDGAARRFGATTYLRLKTKVRALIRECGGQEAAATLSRIASHQAFGRYGRPREPEGMPVDVVVDLEAEVGEPIVTRELADLAGYVLVPLPPAEADPEWVRDLSAMMTAAGETMRGIGEALADDGAVSPDEIDRLGLLDDVQKAMGALANLQAALRAIAAGGYSA